jgi:hypothetical protein
MNGPISPRSIGIATVVALNQFTEHAFLEEMKRTIQINKTPLKSEEIVNGVVHPVVKETITKYNQLIDDPVM